ncbi:MAG: protein kinase [Candidatus Omnitrophica bacterium]|nr:protein kinase [Candidatus Omnitrophota bacterium]
MLKPFYRKSAYIFRKIVSILLLLTFGLSMGIAPAGAQILPNLPTPGQMLWLSPVYEPPVLRGMTVHPENPLLLDFIVDRGQDKINNDLLRDESTKLIKYFLTSMTIPDKDAWVNLSPYEKDRIIPDALGQTEMGRQMLEQDYILKQLSASLTNPDKELGQKFWKEVRARAQKHFGTTEIPLNTFSKVWIVPDGATVVEKDGFAYITESKLKVMLDQDYVAQNINPIASTEGARQSPSIEIASSSVTPRNGIENVSTAVFREMILPQLNKEINTGKNFSATRQVYQSVILAAWYKKALKDSLLGRIYADKSKVEGVESDVQDIKQKVYDQYLEAFKKGVYNVIKEEDGFDGDLIPRKYFSGGMELGMNLNSDQLRITRGSSAVYQVATEMNTAGDGIVVVNANLAETEREAVEINDKAASRWAAKEIPVEFRLSFKDAVRKVSGLTFIYPEDYRSSYIFSVGESLVDQQKFTKIADLLGQDNRGQVIEETYKAFERQTLSVINEVDQRDIKSAIGYFVDAIKEYNTPQVIESESGLVFQFHRISELFESDRAYLIPIVEKFVAQEVANRPELQNNRIVDVEKMKPGSPGTSIYLINWGGQKYIIKSRPIKTLVKFGEFTENKYLTNQVEILTKLNANGGNEHIAKLVSFGTVAGQEYLVTNYLPGQSLLSKVRSEGPQSVQNTVKIAVELAKALEFVHAKGIVYRDLAARNIQVGPDNFVYLYDFDVSSDVDYDWTIDAYKLRDVTSLTDFSEEGFEITAQSFDVQQDIANIGAVLFRTASGKLLINISDISESTIENAALRKIILRSVAPRANRYKNVSDMLADLETLQKSLPVTQGIEETALGVSSSTLSDETIAATHSRIASSGVGKSASDPANSIVSKIEELGIRQEILTFIHKHLSSLGEMNKDQILAILAEAPYVGRDWQAIYQNSLRVNSETANLDLVTLLTKVYKLLILNVLDNFGSIAAQLATTIQSPQEREAFYEFIIKFGRDMDGFPNEQVYNVIRKQPLIGRALGESFAGVSALVPSNTVAQYFKMTLNTAAFQVDRQDFKKDGRTGFVGLTPKIEYTGEGLRKWFKPNSTALPNNIGDNFRSGVAIEPSKIVSNREVAYYLWRYAQSVHGFKQVLKDFLGNDVQDTYFLIDLRGGHSLATAAYLKTLGVDVAYQLPKTTANPKSLAVLAGLLRVPFSQAIDARKNSIATVFDSMRTVELGGYAVDSSMVPTAGYLQRRGIKRIVHISQNATGEYLNQGSGYADLRAVKEQYERAGIENRFFGVDDVALYSKSSEDLFADDIHVFIHSIYGYLEAGAFLGKNFFDLSSIMINNRPPTRTQWVDLSQNLPKDVDPKKSASSSVIGTGQEGDDFDLSAADSLAKLVNGEMTAMQNEAYEMALLDFVKLMKVQFIDRKIDQIATPDEIAGVFKDVRRFISLSKERSQSSQLQSTTFEERIDSFFTALQLSQLSSNTNARGIKLGEYVWASLRTVAEQLNPTSKNSRDVESIALLPDAIYREFTGRSKSDLLDSLIEFYIALSDPLLVASSTIAVQYNRKADQVNPSYERSASTAGELVERIEDILSTTRKTAADLNRAYTERDAYVLQQVAGLSAGKLDDVVKLARFRDALDRYLIESNEDHLNALTGEGLLRWLKANGIIDGRIRRDLDTPPDLEDTIASSATKSSDATKGGIDFDPTLLNLQIKRDGRGVALPLPQQDLEHINIKGFYPVIINIQPLNIQTLPILGFLNNPPEVALSKG